ncbi:AfsR/SARP family transcriptional regulator [Planktotalea sp.]|uniref:AfsR/SARP family transcriptional regulator n=1 Tax=Planktotalea sp. TaxID=2029877 RepID=UPI003D6BF6C5
MPALYRVQFYGAFTLTAPDGRDITPKGSKAKGLLAMLCDVNEMRRARRWIEGRLWSNRSPSQASGSLRQTLSEIRAAFGEDKDVFGADRLNIWLDAALVETDLDAENEAETNDRELLEGLVIRDPEFQEWLRAFRRRHGKPLHAEPVEQVSERKTDIKIRAFQTQSGSAAERIAGDILADQVAKSIEERLSAQRHSETVISASKLDSDLEIRCNVAQDRKKGIVFLQVHRGTDKRVLFSDHRHVPGDISDAISADVIQQLVHSAVSKITHRMPSAFSLDRPEVAASGFSSLGLKQLSRFDNEGLIAAQGHFRQAHATDPNGVYLAWRAFARMAQLIESASTDCAAELDEIQSLTDNALHVSSDNGLTLALVALTRIMLEDDFDAPAELAQRAILWNKNNLFAQQTLAVAYCAVGDTEKAYQISLSCQKSAPQDDIEHLWDLYHSLVCISSGRLEEASAAAARASAAAPTFVAPRRQLVALCAQAGDMAGAREQLKALRGLEAEFSLDRFLNDPDYPVLTLRKAGLLDDLKTDDFED